MGSLREGQEKLRFEVGELRVGQESVRAAQDRIRRCMVASFRDLRRALGVAFEDHSTLNAKGAIEWENDVFSGRSYKLPCPLRLPVIRRTQPFLWKP